VFNKTKGKKSIQIHLRQGEERIQKIQLIETVAPVVEGELWVDYYTGYLSIQ